MHTVIELYVTCMWVNERNQSVAMMTYVQQNTTDLCAYLYTLSFPLHKYLQEYLLKAFMQV